MEEIVNSRVLKDEELTEEELAQVTGGVDSDSIIIRHDIEGHGSIEVEALIK